MKKRYLLPAVLLLMALTLAACNGTTETEAQPELSTEAPAGENPEDPNRPDTAENHADNEPMDPSLIETAAPTSPAPIDGTAEVVGAPGAAAEFAKSNIAGLYLKRPYRPR